MSGTMCSISIMKQDGSIETIYANYNGDISHSGEILLNEYSEYNDVVELITGGNVSGLNEENNYSNKEKAVIFKNKKEFISKNKNCDFNYVFKIEEETWYLMKERKDVKLCDFFK